MQQAGIAILNKSYICSTDIISGNQEYTILKIITFGIYDTSEL